MTCNKCSEVTNTIDVFLDLSIEINRGDVHSVADGLHSFLLPEQLEANGYSCMGSGTGNKEDVDFAPAPVPVHPVEEIFLRQPWKSVEEGH